MSASRQLLLFLLVLVIGWYLVTSFLPQWLGSCLDGECAFTPAEAIVSVLIPIALVAIPVVAEMLLYKKSIGQSLSDIGLTRFDAGAFPMALLYLLPLVLFYPLYSILTQNPLALKPHWEWLLLGAVLNNGLNEETMMRGFVFRHLREGRTFWRAAAFSTVYFAGYHLVLILTLGPLIGIISTISAIPLGLFTAYLYERGSNTLWVPFLMHSANNAFAFIFAFAPDVQPIASSLYLTVTLVTSIVLLTWVYKSGFGRVPKMAPSVATASS